MNEELQKALEALRLGAPEAWGVMVAEHAMANGVMALICLAVVVASIVAWICAWPRLRAFMEDDDTTDSDAALGLILTAIVIGLPGLIGIVSGVASLYSYIQPNVALLELLR